MYFNPSVILTTADEILDATCTMFFVPDTEQESYPTIAVSLLQESVSNPTWNTANYNQVDSVDYEEYPTSINFAMYQDLDITGLVQTWQNYIKTNSVVGSPNYGFKLLASDPTDDYSCISAYSSRYLWPPSFKITYRTQTPYKLYYSPDKYNNKETVTNFQNRMNCYAYALQVYYGGELAKNEYYALKPGEFGLNYNSTINNYYDLCQSYDNFTSNNTDFMNFVEDRMEEDGLALGFSLNRIITSNGLILPNNFNESNERIIAMVVGKGYWTSVIDYHYYVRNGNGTCPNGHGGNCSAWSHKLRNDTISNVTIDSDNYYSHPYLCDENINSYACQGDYSDSPEIRYYSITQDTNIYNSWYGNGHYDESTGTPFVQ